MPTGNRRVLRTVLETLNGNPHLYIRAGAIPSTTPARRQGLGTVHQYGSTGTGTRYGNWTPLDVRSERELGPGTWYFGVNRDRRHQLPLPAQSFHRRYPADGR